RRPRRWGCSARSSLLLLTSQYPVHEPGPHTVDTPVAGTALPCSLPARWHRRVRRTTMEGASMSSEPELTFRGGWPVAFVPVLIFVVLDAFDMAALAVGGFLALLVGALLARRYGTFWDAVIAGIGSATSVSIVLILVVVGMLAQLIKDTDVSAGFVWIADQAGLSGSLLTLFTFAACCLIAMATGSSIGTMFTAFPIFYPAGVLLGADPAVLAGAIVSGAIFGDNLAPISDTTIISASTQRYRHR